MFESASVSCSVSSSFFFRLSSVIALSWRLVSAGVSFSREIFAARGNLHVHHDAVGARWNGQRGVFHVGRFFTEDRAEQSLFRREFRLALRRDFADENVARLHFRADANDAVRTEVAQRFFADVRNVARDFFRAELGVAGADFEFVDVNGSVDVFLHDLLRDHDGVFEVVAVPRHERDEHVAAERELAVLGVRAVRDDLAALHVLALLHDRLLVHAGAGIRAHEFAQFVNVNAGFRIGLHFLAAFGHVRRPS